jgi:large subunit ribosomal protein L19
VTARDEEQRAERRDEHSASDARSIPMHLIEKLDRDNGKPDLPTVHVGDTVEVHYLIREGDKERVQLFIGTVIACKGRGIRRNLTVRRIVQGEGVERIFPLHSPRVKDVVITRRGEVRRAKLYFLRDRVGKQTKVKELLGEKVRKEREFEKAMRAASSEAEPQGDNAPGKPEKQVPVNV